jgi:succinate dehydrogenase / fumarate reductase cytochrome b subunit
MAQAPPAARPTREQLAAQPIRPPRRKAPFFVEFYRSAVGKKWVMAITGLIGLGFVFVHMVGNLKLFLSKQEINLYGEALRHLGGHLVPATWVLWALRLVLIGAVLLHIHAAYSLTVLNRKARPDGYQSPRDYVAADYASRTMRWTGIIVALFILFHLADLTWGTANPEFVRGDPYNNLVYSFQRVPVAIIYIVAMLALGLHLYHGAWSMFQSLGINSPRINAWRRGFAVGFTAIVVVGNLSFPIAVQLGLIELKCPGAPPTLSCEQVRGVEQRIEEAR